MRKTSNHGQRGVDEGEIKEPGLIMKGMIMGEMKWQRVMEERCGSIWSVHQSVLQHLWIQVDTPDPEG